MAPAAGTQRRIGPMGTERVLVLTEPVQSFTFVVDAEPVPSLLREFSAPVVPDDPLGDAEPADAAAP